MFFMLLRKIYKNKWIVMCLLMGLLLCTAMVSSISMYSRAVLLRILTNDLRDFQLENGLYPGAFSVDKILGDKTVQGNEEVHMAILSKVSSLDNEINKGVKNSIPLPVLTSRKNLVSKNITVDTSRSQEGYVPRPSIGIQAISGLEDHIKILKGRMASKDKNSDGEYEVILSEAAARELNLVLDRVYYMYYLSDNNNSEDFSKKAFKVRVTGVYTYKDETDSYFGDQGWQYKNYILMNYDLYRNVFLKDEAAVIDEAHWYYGFDHKKINMSNIEQILNGFDGLENELKMKNDATPILHASGILEDYTGKHAQVKKLLELLQLPVILLLIIYMSMVSNFIVEEDKNEIAVFKSRGAGTFQILPMYLMEGGVIGVIAILLGPILGSYMCRIIGSTNGFLEFVQRKSLIVNITWVEYLYSGIMVLIFIALMMVPVVKASRISIVERKQRLSRFTDKPLWKKYYLDVLFIGMVAYGVYTYLKRINSLEMTAEKSLGSAPIDPLLYIVSALLILGLGMLFLRIYPYIIRIVFWTGKKIWSPSAYISLLNSSRADGKNGFLMIFLIMTVSIGIFNVNAAGTINKTLEKQTRYKNGADIVLSEERKVMDDGRADIDDSLYNKISELDGVKQATKVLHTDNAKIKFSSEESGELGSNILFGINPKEFGEIAYMPKELLPHHFNEYLNLLSKDPRAVLVSSNIGKRYGLKQGDIINISWEDDMYIECYVAAFVDYWPSYIPKSYGRNSLGSTLIVANINLLGRNKIIWPYEVWVKKDIKAPALAFYNEIKESNLRFSMFNDSDQLLIKAKKDAMLQGSNGALTLGFITTMIVTIIGFLMYWISSIKNRTLQFGIFRAMGMNLSKLLGILLYEQILISGISILAGIAIGHIDSKLFIPIIQSASNPYDQAVSIKIAQTASEYISLITCLMFMIVIGFVVLGRYISGIKMDQAIKLGED